MKRIAFLGLAALISACASQKPVEKSNLDSKTETRTETTITQEKAETKQSQTTTYGDSLRGNNFLPLDGGRTKFGLESTGLKVGFDFVPQYATDGRLLGYQVNTEATAKPMSKTTESTTLQANTQAQERIQSKEKVTEQQTTESKGSWLTYILLNAVPVFFIALVIWIYKTFKK